MSASLPLRECMGCSTLHASPPKQVGRRGSWLDQTSFPDDWEVAPIKKKKTKTAACLECGLFRGGGGHPRAGLGLIWAAEPRSREECGRSLRLGPRFLWRGAQPGLPAQLDSPDLVAMLQLPSTWRLEPRAPGRHVAPETELLTPEKRIFVAWPGQSPEALRPIQRPSSFRPPQPWREAGPRFFFPRGRGNPCSSAVASLAERRPRSRRPAGWVGSAAERALGPRGRSPAPSSGGRAQGPRAGPGRQSAPPGAGSAAGARHGLWGLRAPGPARPCPPAMPGFDYKFLEKPKRRLLCPLCGKPMREPVQVSTCGHRFCDTCLQEFLRCGRGRGERGRPAGGDGRRCPGRAGAGSMPALCLCRGSVTSGVPTVTSRGCGDVTPRGRATPHA